MYKQIFKKRDLLGNREFSGLEDCMSTIGLMNKVCAVCGKESEYSVLNSTNTFIKSVDDYTVLTDILKMCIEHNIKQ